MAKVQAMPADWFTGGADGGPAIGLWLGLANAYSAELCATLGFDWLLIDAEHAPNTVRTVLHQLQAISGTASTAVVRPPTTDADTIKRYLDIGARHLLLPMIDSAQQARDAVAASRYPPHGIRGVGSALARASEWGGQTDYLATANTRMRLIAQIETPAAVAAVDDARSPCGQTRWDTCRESGARPVRRGLRLPFHRRRYRCRTSCRRWSAAAGPGAGHGRRAADGGWVLNASACGVRVRPRR